MTHNCRLKFSRSILKTTNLLRYCRKIHYIFSEDESDKRVTLYLAPDQLPNSFSMKSVITLQHGAITAKKVHEEYSSTVSLSVLEMFLRIL